VENNWFAIYLILALFLLFSGTMLRLSRARRSPLKADVPRPQPVYTGNAKPAPVPQPGEWNPPSKVAHSVPALTGPASSHNGVQPRIVAGSDYLRNNPLSHLHSYRAGLEGEQRVVNRMQSVLDGQWTIFHNVDLGDRQGDIDVVLVGPGGIWAFEVKTYTGNIRVKDGRWYRETSGGRMAKMQRGPGAQILTNARRLCAYLKQHGVTYKNYVEPIVVMSGEAPVEVISAGTTIWKLEELDARLSFLKSYQRYSQDQVRLVVSVIESACTPGARLH
jgi:Nuclease-related domain